MQTDLIKRDGIRYFAGHAAKLVLYNTKSRRKRAVNLLRGGYASSRWSEALLFGGSPTSDAHSNAEVTSKSRKDCF